MSASLVWVLAAGPIVLLGLGFVPGSIAERSSRRFAGVACGAAAAALAGAVAGAVAVAVRGPWRSAALGFHGIGFGLYVDALSAATAVLVAFIGLIVLHYSRRYLEGDPARGRFFRWIALTLGAVLLLILAGNLLQFILAWIVTSVGLHRLLLFYPDRPLAVLAARKKFLASRVGDLCLVAAAVLLHAAVGTLDYGAFLGDAVASQLAAARPGASHAAAICLVVAVLLKSAQFPLHGWLVEVMETPTPVSALLHAGVINAGGFLALRFSALIAQSPAALALLIAIGGVTALYGSLVMLPQTSIKVSLAYSTVGQMGFMMMECGLGAFSAAWLHIAGHSLYKAHAFLSSGSVVDIARGSWSASPGGQPHPWRWLAVLLSIVGVTLVVGIGFGGAPVERPAPFALTVILLLGLAHFIASSVDERAIAYVITRTCGSALAIGIAFLVLHRVVERWLAGAVAAEPTTRGGTALLVVAATLAAFAAVILLQSLLPVAASSARGRAIYVHLANGLYVNVLTNRLLAHGRSGGRSGHPPPRPDAAAAGAAS